MESQNFGTRLVGKNICGAVKGFHCDHPDCCSSEIT
ncbi:hypothetical protein F383_08276 [Gossypium arboreum]|uniref:Uncharacterized protein n=1 Tax=Gossypium arboreum TaxID=29729 RepID=A0A0B0NW08_GOSAR|nr:hypothetical protein F383_08276 [Gossypium arboreum]